MPKTIAIFGAGTGLGASVAHRFGREGFRIALIGRRPAPLDSLVRDLAADGIEAHAFPADLSNVTALPAFVEKITHHFGGIDVIEYAPVSNLTFHPAMELTAELLQGLVDLYLLAPVELVRAVLPQMLARSDGAILLGQGYSAVEGAPFMSGVGPVMAAARNYIYSLHGELAPLGIYAGTLTVTAMIERSEGHSAATSGEFAIHLPEGQTLPVVSPDDLADQYWELYTNRNRAEQIHPAA
ncbi:SDR family NAD(P)-dependent oxidoreductase [Subtercola endophyticus]|uniref:SDR family NAD(P)-dependent oxidoreductase n=1 Tax=Subtercola endophyticus TaxID=2895559 RepID=UPI001E32916F|nr:SDR family oxidoreductase [Subtercola endophyticus]UFS58183.1 SDR family oxidoreductase [Subtercola endophyticus]